MTPGVKESLQAVEEKHGELMLQAVLEAGLCSEAMGKLVRLVQTQEGRVAMRVLGDWQRCY